ncbi:MAG TPA: hypothetical protein ENJ95_04380 [Bacteroidetes bacterium]|nr:hypothetical protein [Bacteroidota bacterium]
MKNTSQAISKKPGKVVPLSLENGHVLSDDEKFVLDQLNKGELISPKFTRLLEKEVVKIAGKLYMEKPGLSKKEFSVEIINSLPERLPGMVYVRLLKVGMETWLDKKYQ